MTPEEIAEHAKEAALKACDFYGHKGLAAFGNGRFDLAYKAAEFVIRRILEGRS